MKEFKKTQELFSSIYHASRDAIGYATLDGTLVDVNESFAILTGYSKEELLSGKRYQDITPKEYQEYEAKIIEDILTTGEAHEYEKEYIRKDGSRVPILLTVFVIRGLDDKPVGVAAIIKDITERKKAEQALIEAKDDLEIQARGLQKTNDGIRQLYKELEQKTKELEIAYNELKETQMRLAQSEKLAAVGLVASGVAHEINNPLAVISGEAEMLLKDKDKDEDVKEATKIIMEQAKRIKTINQRLLEFSRKREPKFELLDINKALEESMSLLGHQIKSDGIEIIKELSPSLPKLLGDKNQLQEVFLNIMLNAVEAMEGKGKLTIKTYAEKIREYGRRKQDLFKLGQKIVIIELTDTGKGMDEDTIKKVFDPFFTTKEKNTGLGLSISYGIIQSHNGSIEVYSKLGAGSTFVVKLPIMNEQGGEGL